MVGHKSDGPQVVFNVCQSHRHDSTHPSLFYQVGYHLYICGVQHSWAKSHITLWSNAGRTVTHPCINQAHDYILYDPYKVLVDKYGGEKFNSFQCPAGVNPFLFSQLCLYYYAEISREHDYGVQSVYNQTDEGDISPKNGSLG